MFNATIHHIEAESKLIWRYQRFLLVQEYLGKTLLPPPLNIPCYIFYLLQFFWRKYCMTRVYMRMRMCCRRKRQTEPDAELKRRKKSVDSSIKLMNNYVETYQMRREKEIAEEYWKDIIISEEGKQRQMESDLSKMKIKVEKILNDFDQMRQRKKKGKFIDPEMQDVFKGIIIGDLEPVLDDQQDLPPTRSQTDRKATLNDAAPRQQSNDEVDRSQRAVSVNEDFCEEEKEVIEDEGEILPELSTECVASENSAQSSLPSWTGDQLTTNHPHIAPVQSTQLIYAASRRGKV
ncbi:unnamed protein product [Didymodactylos carnosus]|uniref:Uncharacterized protein n=1 Tax=Didymodactylos carnosus TaxID=1234261 RepID=A0A8S2TRE7_9BILA|nr:unnamed protein product [Didymodactylos carnosus]CAF4304622.1 unnamed protein product [Didymodactylos carnosus]